MLTVSNYHYIRPEFKSKYQSIFGVTPSVFKTQLELLKNEGDFISCQDLENNYKDVVKSKENHILITFDDGLKEQYTYALPILEDLKVRAAFFANSSNFKEKRISIVHKIHLLRSILAPTNILKHIAKKHKIGLTSTERNSSKTFYKYDSIENAELKYLLNYKLPFKIQKQLIDTLFDEHFEEEKELEKLYMSIDHIKNLASMSCLGSHTHNHFPLGLLDKEEITYELEVSKAYFENLTKTTINSIAYPYGTSEACTLEVASLTKEAGYSIGFTTAQGINNTSSNPLLLQRFDCNDLVGGKNYKR